MPTPSPDPHWGLLSLFTLGRARGEVWQLGGWVQEMAPSYPLGSPYSRHEHSGSVLRRPFILGTPGVEASAPCPTPGSGSWAGYTPPQAGPSSSSQDRQGHIETGRSCHYLVRTGGEKEPNRVRGPDWGWGTSQGAEKLRGGGRGLRIAPDQRQRPLASSRAGAH